MKLQPTSLAGTLDSQPAQRSPAAPHIEPLGAADKVYVAGLGVTAACAVSGATLPTGLAAGFTAGAGYAARRIDAGGLSALGSFAAVAAFYDVHRPHAALAMGLTAGTTAFAMHRMPGFDNPRWLRPCRLRADGLPYRAFVNGDKVLSGALLLSRLQQAARPAVSAGRLLAGATVGVGTIAALMGAGLASGFVGFDPHPPDAAVSLLWALYNLFFVAIPEEALFRGLIQGGLATALGPAPVAQAAALVGASGIFGLAHLPNGGWHYAALATVAGAGYGWVAQLTGRLEAAIFAHFALNLTHFLLFTYPARAPR